MVAPVEQAAANAFLNGVVGWFISELQKNYKLWKRERDECESLRRELLILANAVDDELSRRRGAPRTAVARAYSEEMLELTHDIEDCLECFLRQVTCKEGASWPRRAAHTVWMSRTRLRFAKEIKKLQKRSAEARSRILNIAPSGGGGQPSSTSTTTITPPVESAQPDNPVGIAEATEKLRALLLDANPAKEAPTTQPMVVAIVGFGGSGKTTLARAVYDSLDDEAFPCRAWVAVSLLEHSDVNGILTDIHRQLHPSGEYSAAALAEYFKAMKNRYLIVIDDIKKEHMKHWDTIRNTFKGNGRTLVTTATQSIANRCSSSEETNTIRTFGYVYKMRTLGEEDSMVVALQGRRSPELVQGSAALLKKCDGLPLALASVARQLNSENEPTGKFCAELCRDLGYYLEREDDDDEPNFARLRGVLMENYTSLSDYTVRTCLLYLGIFPTNHPLKRNVIIRRWLAEGYARSNPLRRELMVADGNFKAFVDRSIIQPVDPSKNATVKTCKTPGIMHVFMLHKSMSKKFIMPFGAHHKKVRHLFVHGNNSTRTTFNTDLSRVRSLTVLGNACDAISDFRKYKLLRVLDLEGCTDVEDGHLKDICKLWNLRYLSLGPGVTYLPNEIAQLKFLETIHVSKTRVNLLPVEVIGLPCLIHLIGKFKLQDPVEREQLPKQLKMETLAGFVTDGHERFLQLMVHMKKLNKVKIWYEPVESCDSAQLMVDMNNVLSEAIRNYIKVPMELGDFRSLSIDFNALPEGSLYALRDHLCNHSLPSGNMYYLSSLKLRGNSSTLLEFVALFRDLTELSLSTTVTVTQEFISALSEMPCLLYLKLTTNCIDGLIVQAQKFKSLRRICLTFVVTIPTLLIIEDGAFPELVSLQLLCEHLVGLSGIQIKWLRELKEIVLHPAVAENTRETWEAAAINHPNRPNVFPIRKVDDRRNNEPAPDKIGTKLQTKVVEGLEHSPVPTEHENSTSIKKNSSLPLFHNWLAGIAFRKKAIGT